MTKFVWVVLIGLLVSSATAQIHPDADGLGLYFDLAGTAYEFQTMAPFQQVSVYLLATNVTDPAGISGWECAVNVSGVVAAPSWTVSAGLNVADGAAGLFQVGIGLNELALPAAPTVLLATWTGFVMAPGDVVEFLVTPYPGSVSFPDSAGYASGSDAGHLIPFDINGGCFGSGWTIINMWCPLRAQELSWSEVKSLYR